MDFSKLNQLMQYDTTKPVGPESPIEFAKGLGRVYQSYAAAPVRAAAKALQDGKPIGEAFANQFGADPDTAPTAKDLVANDPTTAPYADTLLPHAVDASLDLGNVAAAGFALPKLGGMLKGAAPVAKEGQIIGTKFGDAASDLRRVQFTNKQAAARQASKDLGKEINPVVRAFQEGDTDVPIRRMMDDKLRHLNIPDEAVDPKTLLTPEAASAETKDIPLPILDEAGELRFPFLDKEQARNMVRDSMYDSALKGEAGMDDVNRTTQQASRQADFADRAKEQAKKARLDKIKKFIGDERGKLDLSASLHDEPLPMDEASRLVRAKEMGFDMDNPLYHGTPETKDFDAFRASDSGNMGKGVYATNDPKYASTYAQPGRGFGTDFMTKEEIRDSHSRVLPLVTNAKVLDLDNPEHLKLIPERLRNGSADAVGEEISNLAKEMGYGGVKRGSASVVFDPKNLRSKFAEFDPSKKDLSNLSAGLAAMIGAAGTKALKDSE
jgi:hypothetical protein